MNNLLTKFLSACDKEYLVTNQNWEIIEISLTENKLISNLPQDYLGKDVRTIISELVGLDNIAHEIIHGKRSKFEIKGIKIYPDRKLYIDICILPNFTESSDKDKLILLISDATERMILEQSLVQGANETSLLLKQLTASKQYIDRVVTSMADALLVTTPSGKIKTINLAAEILLESKEVNLLEKHISVVLPKFDNLPINNFSNTENSDVLTKEVETICQTKSGKSIPVAFSCAKIKTEIERFRGYIYILRDMTERKQAELAKQEFLAIISHEIRTPISSVMGIADLLLETELEEEQQEFVKTIYTSGNSLLKIVNDILDFAKIESGKLELEAQPFYLCNCIQEAICLLSLKAENKKLTLNFNPSPNLPEMIVGDITRLRQILLNLIGNAIKFTSEGRVEVFVNSHEIGKTQAGKELYEIQFAVKDTGIGIPQDRLDRLFQSFSQVNSSITRKYGGTGLGLSICRQLTELMGGRIWVESKLGESTTFYFTIIAPIFSFELQNGILS